MNRVVCLLAVMACLLGSCRQQPQRTTGEIDGTPVEEWIDLVTVDLLNERRERIDAVMADDRAFAEFVHAGALGNVHIRRAVVRMVEESGARHLPTLEAMLDSRDPDLLVVVCGAIGVLGRDAERSVPKLAEVLRRHSPSDDRRVMEAAWVAMVDIGPGSLPAIMELLEDESLRDRALNICGEFGLHAVVQLEKYDASGDSELGQEILRAIAGIRSSQVGLFGTLRSQREFLELRRRRLANTVRVGGGVSEELARELEIDDTTIGQALERLNDIMESDDPAQRRRAAQVLVRFGWMADRLTPALVKAIERPDMHLRWSAAEVFGRLGPDGEPGIPGLLAMAADNEDPTGQRIAINSLGQIGRAAREAFPLALERLHDRSWNPRHMDDPLVSRQAATVALARLDPAIAPAHLIEVLDEPRWMLRRAGVIALALCGPHAVPVLEQALRDGPASRVHDAAYTLLLMGQRHGSASMVLAAHPATDDPFLEWCRAEAQGQFMRQYGAASAP